MLDVRTAMRGPALVIIALVAGCKGNPTCEKFVDMSTTCPDKDFAAMSDIEKSQTKEVMYAMCENAMNDSTVGTRNDREKMMITEMNASIRKKAECVAAAKTCEDAKRCD